ncbi:unnamed protein product [Meganyctiphanes norvegica]|uniref:Uncharacterized protein n=1 Tax=Meganyctiphanes norvegica TaxID=48144 RepID=A0AAV2SIK7_MEGNR
MKLKDFTRNILSILFINLWYILKILKVINLNMIAIDYYHQAEITTQQWSILFLKTLIPYIKKHHPHLNKVYYFTGGILHSTRTDTIFNIFFKYVGDFGLQCRWYFFVTSHGKSSCDGIGGTVKWSVDKASLQKVFERYFNTREYG